MLEAYKPSHETLPLSMSLVSQVGGKHEHAFHQRDRYGGDHNDGDGKKNLTRDSRDKKQGHEGHDIRQNAESDRLYDFPSSLYGSLQVRVPLLTVFIDVFPDHDGIIHHNAKGNDEREHGHHIDADAQRG